MVTGLLGFACFLWVLGIIFGIIALRQIRERNQKGKGMAVTGIVAGAVWPILLAVLLVVGVAASIHDEQKSNPTFFAPSHHVDAFSLYPGDCFNRDSSAAGPKSAVTVVPCSVFHDGEVYARDSISGNDTYPGSAQVIKQAKKGCSLAISSYLQDPDALPSDVTMHLFYPDEMVWRTASYHQAICFFAGHDQRSDSLRDENEAISPAQLVYLKAVKNLTAALASVPDGQPADHPQDFRNWATQVVNASSDEVDTLHSRTWDGSAAPAVANLASEVTKGAAHWQAAADSTDTAVLVAEIHQGLAYPGNDATDQVRSALGLPPAGHDSGESADGDPSADPSASVKVT
jgi:hypothetical protein